MRKKMTLFFCAFVCAYAAFAQTQSRDFLSAWPLVNLSRQELLRHTTGKDALLQLVSDTLDPRYVAVIASEGSGIVQQFVYLYVCDSSSSCELRAMYAGKWSGATSRVAYREGQGFSFYDDERLLMRVFASLPLK